MILLLLGCDPSGGESKRPDSDSSDTATDSQDTGGDSSTDTSDSDSTGEPPPSWDTCSVDTSSDALTAPYEDCDPALAWTDVDCSAHWSCGIRQGGCIECWGNTGNPDPPGLSFRTLALPNDFGGGYGGPPACGLLTTGEIACWGGTDLYGQSEPPMGTYVDMTVGAEHSYALTSDGTLRVWGNHNACFLTDGVKVVASNADAAILSADGTVRLLDMYGNHTKDLDGTWSTIEVGGGELCGMRSDRGGAIECMLADGSPNPYADPAPDGDFVSLCVTERSGYCALDAEGIPACWGDPQVGDPLPGPFVKLSCGDRHVCALTADGDIQCWGVDDFGDTVPPS